MLAFQRVQQLQKFVGDWLVSQIVVHRAQLLAQMGLNCWCQPRGARGRVGAVYALVHLFTCLALFR